MAECKNFIRPSGLDMIIYTSDVSLYDGQNLSCITIANGASLNDVIASIDQAVCALNSAVLNPNVDADNVSYGGTTVFGCYTITGTNVEAVIEEIFTELCALSTTVDALDGTIIRLGSNVTSTCLSFVSNDKIRDVINSIVTEVCSQDTRITAIEGDYVTTTQLAAVTSGNDFVVSGANRTLAGLFLGLSSSSYYIDGIIYTKGLTANIALTATADNYVDYDVSSAGYTVTAVTVGNPAPAIASDAIRLWKFTTDGLGVTAETDLRVYGFVDNSVLLDNAVSTAKIQNLAVTGAKLETIGAGATFGDSDIFTLTYDTKGRVTGGTFNIDLTGLAAGDLLQWDGANWVVLTPPYIDGTGTAGRLPRNTDANTVTTSAFYDDGSNQGLNAAVAANIQFNIATTEAYGVYLTSSGTNASNIGYYVTVSGGTSSNVGLYGKAEGELSGLVSANSNIGMIGTAITLNADVAYGGKFGVDGDGASTGKVIGLYTTAQTSGSGEAIGLVVEAGGAVLGATTKSSSAILQLDSTTQGFVVPRMTNVEAAAISSPFNGMMIYVSSSGGAPFTSVGFYGYQGGAWAKF